MADLNKFKRSKERISEVLHYLMAKTTGDDNTNSFIISLQNSLRLLDSKLEDFKNQGLIEH